ncbi:hypothetical protein B6N60_00127 [Richelia sinica FACHB-800]|uniref:Uncharacterized protein n=1 Tax=Richelia sinica FACHB-800 TaxID=1357546 RepID=A0A975T3E9_9NOST|nr:hypothetical protein B6N60_00127 [Richelia sinica FACHB-800]
MEGIDKREDLVKYRFPEQKPTTREIQRTTKVVVKRGIGRNNHRDIF